MLKVTEIKSKAGTTLMLEGKLLGPWVDELRSFWGSVSARQERVPILVDLKDLSFADAHGRDLLNRMEQEGARLVEASDFIRHLLGSKSASGGGSSANGIK